MVNYKLSLDDIGNSDVTVIFRYRGGVEFIESPLMIKALLMRSTKLIDQALAKMIKEA